MDFNFGDDAKKEEDKDDGLLSEDEDLTKGLDEATVRKLLNAVGRSASHMLVASTLVAKELKEGPEVDAITAVVFKNHMRHAMKYITDDGDFKKVLPYCRL